MSAEEQAIEQLAIFITGFIFGFGVKEVAVIIHVYIARLSKDIINR